MPWPQDRLARARALVAGVPDPEIPVLTLEDLGILREVSEHEGQLRVVLTPTYTGCPATEAIRDDVRRILAESGYPDALVQLTLSPPWSSDWISARGRQKLREYGIAPPARAGSTLAAESAVDAGSCLSGGSHGTAQVLRFMPRRASDAPHAPHAPAAPDVPVSCPRCGSSETETLSEHGSTPCKALHRCRSCREPFDYFKPY